MTSGNRIFAISGASALVFATAVACELGFERTAHAADAEVTSDTQAQFYDVRSPNGEVILPRRRLTTTLGAFVSDLTGNKEGAIHKPNQPDLQFRARLRYDADFGASPGEADSANPAGWVPGFERGPIDLMYAYVEGRRYLGGWLGFRLGRQYVTDSLGWYAFDGGQVSLTTPVYMKVEAYGGLEVRGGMPLSTSRYEADGMWRGNRTGVDPSLYTSFQPNGIAPVVGAAVESTGVQWIHGRLTYRRSWNTGASSASQFASGLYTPTAYSGGRVSQERIGYSMNANFGNVAGAKAGLAYDLYLAKMTSVYASVDVFAGSKVTLSLDYDYFQPSFDADSIWNFFASEPMNDLGLRANVNVTDRFSVAAGGHVRIFNQQTENLKDVTSPNISLANDPNFYPSNGVAFNEGGDVSARYKTGTSTLGARANGNFGDGGKRVGADIYAEKLYRTRFVTQARASVWGWEDTLRPDRATTSVGYVAGLGYKFLPKSQAMIEWEHNVNRLVGQRFRLMVWLTVAVAK